MARIAGSPLGLVGLQSNDTNKVFENYNNRNRSNGKGMVSLFSGDRIVRPFGDLNKNDINGSKSFNNSTPIHSNDLYNTTIDNIVDKLKDTKAELNFLDFAYLKDVGVYPNNRLMIARRFATPQMDNIMYNKGDERGSLVTLISWKPTGQDFLEISFGEEWDDAEASFKAILSEVGKDFKLPGDLGNYLEGGGGIVPLPGSTELLQREFFASIGLLDPNLKDQIPEGNPNLIKQAKIRKLVKAGTAGSGLNCKVDIKMTCTWEQKYIQGIDPTLAWMDIVSMVGRFGTSTSQNYGLSGEFAKDVNNFLEDPSFFIKSSIEAIKCKIGDIIDSIANAFEGDDKKTTPSNSKPENIKKEKENEEKNSVIDNTIDRIKGLAKSIPDTITKKYRERILGVLNSLSGLPSTPWHVTLGNPLRPVFCSGDMLIGDVTLKFGENLSFNDLPTTITADFTLTNARPWGLQEIMAKFNSGHIRVLSYANDDKGRLGDTKIGDFSLTEDIGTEINEDKVDVTLDKSDSLDGLNTSSDVNPVTTNNSLNNQSRLISTLPTEDIINSDPNSNRGLFA